VNAKAAAKSHAARYPPFAGTQSSEMTVVRSWDVKPREANSALSTGHIAIIYYVEYAA
jgi:hypothetical protein